VKLWSDDEGTVRSRDTFLRRGLPAQVWMVAKGAIALLVVVVMGCRWKNDGDAAAVVSVWLRSKLPFIHECNVPESSMSELPKLRSPCLRRTSPDCGVLVWSPFVITGDIPAYTGATAEGILGKGSNNDKSDIIMVEDMCFKRNKGYEKQGEPRGKRKS
jgi:hypothetical protein